MYPPQLHCKEYFRCLKTTDFQGQECSICPESLQDLTNCSTCPGHTCSKCSMLTLGDNKSPQRKDPEFLRKKGANYFTIDTIQDVSGKIWYRIITVFKFLNGSEIWKEVAMKTKPSIDQDFIVMDDASGSTIDRSDTTPAAKQDLQDAKYFKYNIEGDTFRKQSSSDVANLEYSYNSKDFKERKASEYNFQMQLDKTVENSSPQPLDEKENVENFIKGNKFLYV